MNLRKNIHALGLTALMLVAAVESHATPVTIDFDGLTSTGSFSAGTEDGFAIIRTSGPIGLNNNYLAPASGGNSIHHQSAGNASFTLGRSDGGNFTLTSFLAGSAFGGANPLTVQGYLDGALIATDVFSAIPNGSFAAFAPTNLSGRQLDNLVFAMGPASAGPTHLDNIVLDTTAVPEPASLALLGAGLLAARFSRRRKPKAA
jgi:hypothetical protein